MAVNSKKVLKNRIGLPTKEEMLAGKNTDNMQAAIVDPNSGEAAPASLTEGEYVFDVPSIIGLGNGDYNAGLDKIKRVHEELRNRGLFIMEKEQANNGQQRVRKE